MPRRGSLFVSFIALSIVAAKAGAAEDDESVQVMIVRPEAGAQAVGSTRLEAEAWPEERVERVEFYVDGRLIGEVATPPYQLIVDLGEDPGARTIVAVAHGGGTSARDELTTGEVRIDDVLELNLQQLYVTVGMPGHPALGLERRDFEVFDEGKTQEIVTFERGDVPLTATLLVDSSRSMRGERLAAALAGARTFVSAMRPLDEAQILLFSDHLVHATPFTRFREILTAGLDGAVAGGGSAVNDHLYLALKQLEARQGRRVVVMLSDGIDVDSVLGMDEVLWKVRYSQALVYWLRLHREDQPLLQNGQLVAQHSWWRSADEHQRQFRLLGDAIEASGGRVIDLHTLAEIEPAFRSIMDELRSQYALGYYPRERRKDGSWHKVEVRVSKYADELVRSREGYIDF